MNAEGMEDRYYFSDWGGCTCSESDGYDEDCPLYDATTGEHNEEDED